MQSTAFDEPAEINTEEAELLNDLCDISLYSSIVTGEKYDSASASLRRVGVCKRDGPPIRSQSFSDCGPDAARSAGHECDFAGKFL
jgi:hypothetical protein